MAKFNAFLNIRLNRADLIRLQMRAKLQGKQLGPLIRENLLLLLEEPIEELIGEDQEIKNPQGCKTLAGRFPQGF